MTATAIMIDSREPEWVQKLTFNGLPTVVTMLDTSDAMIATDSGDMVLVERKTPDDFLNSLRDERVLPQLARMQDVTKWAYLCITGDFLRGPNGAVVTDRGQTGWNWAAVQGALLTIQEMGVFVVYCAGDSDYEACLLRLANRDRKPDLLLAPPRFPRILSAGESIIASLPGIGTDRLTTVMDKCPSAAWALVELTDPASDIPGVGQGIKNRIRAALGLADKTELVITADENGREQLVLQRS